MLVRKALKKDCLLKLGKMDIKEAIEKHLKHVQTKGTHVVQLFANDLIIYIKYTVEVIERKIPDSDSDGSDIYEAEITKVAFDGIDKVEDGISDVWLVLSIPDVELIEDIFNHTASKLIGKKYDW